MIIDSSAILAIFQKEPGFEKLVDALYRADAAGIGCPTLTEAGIVLTARLGRDARGLLARFLQEFQIVEVPFGEFHWRAAIDAYTRFGKGRNKAALNFGDCMTYATAKLAGEPLLFVGRDFHHTDLESVV